MIKLTLPLKNANIIIVIDTSGDFVHTKMYLATSENRYLGIDNLKRTQKTAKKIKDIFEQYLDHTLNTKYDETGLFAYSETLFMANFVYKDLNPRVKIYFDQYEIRKCEIMEFSIDDEMIREWINQLDHILSI